MEELVKEISTLTEAEGISRITDVLALEERYETLLNIIDSMGDGVFVVDENGKMLFCNKSSEHIIGYGMLNLEMEERVRLIGNYLPDMVTPFPPDELPISRALRGESTDQKVYFVKNERRATGVWVSVSGRPLRNQSAEIIGGVIVFRDITKEYKSDQERRCLEEQMFRTQKLESLGVLAGGIAHDFNNLLMGVVGNTDLALLDESCPESVRNRLEHVAVAAKRLAELTNQLLAYSGQSTLIEQPVNISKLLLEMSDLLKPVVSKKADVRFSCPIDLPLISGDATQIRQVLMNLITNASDALGNNPGVVTLRTGEVYLNVQTIHQLYLREGMLPGRYIFAEVTDSGSGMDEDTLSRMFDPFFTTKFTGRGLGLAAVLGIVRKHGGAIQVESSPGKGTQFRVFFPLVEGQPEAANTVTTPYAGAPVEKGLVLLIDDEEPVLTVVADMLRGFGYEALIAASGREGIETFRRHRQAVDIVILDLTMPDMGGEEVLRHLLHEPSTAKIILSSGYDESKLLENYAIHGYLQKPYGAGTLRDALSNVLSA